MRLRKLPALIAAAVPVMLLGAAGQAAAATHPGAAAASLSPVPGTMQARPVAGQASPGAAQTTSTSPCVVQATPSPGNDVNYLQGVAAASATTAWAVGDWVSVDSQGHGTEGTLIEDWNGTSWTRDPSGVPDSVLYGVATSGATNAWAVGYMNQTSPPYAVPLAEHWNGTKWAVRKSVPTPTGAEYTLLNGITRVPGTRQFVAAGDSYNQNTQTTTTLIETWNPATRAWSIVATPNPSGAHASYLLGITALSGSNIWAVGATADSSGTYTTLTEHWDGTAWAIVPSPSPDASFNQLQAISGSSGSNLWAVGWSGKSPEVTLVEHWNGTAWGTVSAPSPGTKAILYGVASSSAKNAVAVGWGTGTTDGNSHALVLKWNGTAWKSITAPSDSGASGLYSVANVPGVKGARLASGWNYAASSSVYDTWMLHCSL